jgi:hypothetical protein
LTVTDPQPGVSTVAPGVMAAPSASTANLTRNSRAERARMPVALHVAEDVAIQHGVCIRPVTLRVTDTLTGEMTLVDVPCGATMEAKCPPCAKRAQRLRMHQCRAGWHAESDPIPDEDPANDPQRDLVAVRADVTATRDEFLALGDVESAEAAAETLELLDAELAGLGVRGSLEPERSTSGRRTRSTRRRQDAPDLPKKAMAKTTLGQTFTGNGGTVYRPSMFVTVTLPSYGRVNRTTGVPVTPERYNYRAAARDAIHFSRLLDRLVQNLRRVAGYDVQYFATIEPQRRLAPHAHFAIRGVISRALLKQVIAATYHQVWWPPTDEPVYVDPRHLPIWDEDADDPDCGGYLDPQTGAFLPTWDEALNDLDDLADLYTTTGNTAEIQPQHVVRFGVQADIKGLISGTLDADRRIGYLAKYLTKDIAHCHDDTDGDLTVAGHTDRLVEALRYEPCSPTCANWLRYGIQPKNARAGMTPGACQAKAHKREHLGYGGRRVLVSRKWSGKTLADHRHERRAFVLALLGIDPTTESATAGDKTSDRYVWEPINPSEAPPLATRLLHAIVQRQTWRAAYESARDGNGPPAADSPVTFNPPKPAAATEGNEPS